MLCSVTIWYILSARFMHRMFSAQTIRITQHAPHSVGHLLQSFFCITFYFYFFVCLNPLMPHHTTWRLMCASEHERNDKSLRWQQQIKEHEYFRRRRGPRTL